MKRRDFFKKAGAAAVLPSLLAATVAAETAPVQSEAVVQEILKPAASNLRSLEVLNLRNSRELMGLITETLRVYPEIDHFSAIPAEMSYSTVRPISYDRSSKFDFFGVRCNLMDASWKIEKEIVDEFAWGPAFFLAEQTRSHLEAAFSKITKQIWYGRDRDPKGFWGISDYLNSIRHPLVIDAGGRLDDSTTSVFAVSTKDVSLVWGENGRIYEGKITSSKVIPALLPESHPQKFSPFNSGNADYAEKIQQDTVHGESYEQALFLYTGLQVRDRNGFGRICNIDKEHPLTENLLAELVSRVKPDILFMSRAARTSLHRERTKDRGRDKPPIPFPCEFRNIPIYITDSISATESALKV